MTEKIQFGCSQASATINAPKSQIDLSEWMFTLTSEEYQACATGHQSASMGQLFDGKRMTINVETMGNAHLVQHYIETTAKPDHVLGVSPNTAIWIKDGPFFTMEVHWDMHVEEVNDGSCKLTCTVTLFTSDAGFQAVLNNPALKQSAENNFNEHINEETPLFAKDIERKALARIWSKQDLKVS